MPSRLNPDDLKRVEEYLQLPQNQVERRPFRPWLQGKYRLFFDKQFAVGKMANLPDAHTARRYL